MDTIAKGALVTLIAILLGTLAFFTTATYLNLYNHCQAKAPELSVNYDPIHGCTATYLGTKVRL